MREPHRTQTVFMPGDAQPDVSAPANGKEFTIEQTAMRAAMERARKEKRNA